MGGSSAPFRGTASGLTARQLARHTRLHTDVYLPRGSAIDAPARARAAHLYADGRGILGGLSAAAVHGTGFLDDDAPAELIRPRTGSARACGSLIVHRCAVPPQEMSIVDGMCVTTPARTAFDLGRRPGRDGAVRVLDALFRATRIGVADVDAIVAEHPRMHGVNRLRRALALADGGAESPQETRTRLLLIDAGLTAPETQVQVVDSDGMFVARLDMGWPQWKVAVEYDGAWHWESAGRRSHDIVRHERLADAGWRVVRVTAGQLHGAPHHVLARVLQQLRAAGAPV